MYSWLWNQIDNGLYYFLLVLVDVFVLCLEILQIFLKQEFWSSSLIFLDKYIDNMYKTSQFCKQFASIAFMINTTIFFHLIIVVSN